MIGRHISELDTPALCIDLNQMAANMRSMADFMRLHGKHWRPHVKCHKTPQIAQMQLDCGAIGVTAAKTSEAHVFIDADIQDVLIANMVIGEQKLERVVKMRERGNPIVACDHFVQAEALSDVCRQRGVQCRVLIEVDIGLNRVGIRPGPDALQLARGVDSLPGVKLVGIMGYEGHLLTEPDPEKKERLIWTAISLLENLRDGMHRSGICCDIVSAGGTGSYLMTARHPAVTEIQAGGGIFADPFYLDRCGVTGLSPALIVTATVVSRPCLTRAVLDVGRKSIHPDIHPPQIVRMANGKELTDATVSSLSAEHLVAELGSGSQDLIVGDRVVLIPGYSDHTTVLHDQFYGLRDGHVEIIWPIAARGKLH